MIFIGIVIFILALGIIVLVHEAGHLIVAKRNGVYCHEFSIGLGPKIFQFYQDKSGTTYNLRWIPIGGYVQMAGENTGFEKDEQIPSEAKFDAKKKWPKFKILVAGSMMNFILAFLLFFIYSFFSGVGHSNQIEVLENSPISNTAIVSGDIITKIDNENVENFKDIKTYLTKNEKSSYSLTYEHKGIENTQDLQVKEGENLGISAYQQKYRFFRSIFNSFRLMVFTIMYIFVSIGLLFTQEYGLHDLSGPIGIAAVTTQAVSVGLLVTIFWVGFLSLNIGFMNLLPIPALDGGRVFFLFIELIIGKKIPPKIETVINNIVFIALLLLIVYVSFADVFRLVS